MSADNWGTCPRCEKRNKEIWERWKREAEESYGKVTPDEYERKRQAALSGPTWDRETFREDFSVGLYKDNTFRVIYKGSCTVCSFTHEYSYQEDVKP